jgi:integrase/recombinase XerD
MLLVIRWFGDKEQLMTISARLALSSEVVQLRLEDLDWCNATVRVRARKTGRGAILPLTGDVGTALAEYLQHGRPDTVCFSAEAGTPSSRKAV